MKWILRCGPWFSIGLVDAGIKSILGRMWRVKIFNFLIVSSKLELGGDRK